MEARLVALEQKVAGLENRLKWNRRAMLALVCLGGVLLSTEGEAFRGAQHIRLVDRSTGEEAILTPRDLTFAHEGGTDVVLNRDGVGFFQEGRQRVSVDISEAWTGLSVFGPNGAVAVSAGVEGPSGGSVKVFSPQEKQLRAELAARLLDAGSGVRLYDRGGFPRATLYADRRGEAGVEFTDADRQPRVDIYARNDGQSVIRASDSEAAAVVEFSVIPESDAYLRYTGVYDEEREANALVPMLYMNDKDGKRLMQMPNPPVE